MRGTQLHIIWGGGGSGDRSTSGSTRDSGTPHEKSSFAPIKITSPVQSPPGGNLPDIKDRVIYVVGQSELSVPSHGEH